jgi:type IV pilus assembly protein PilX
MTGFVFSRGQRGAVLVVALILLFAMSMLAATSMRGATLQVRMSANAYDRDLAFQSAEAGLRMGERTAENWAAGTIVAPSPSAACPGANAVSGLYVTDATGHANCKPLWERPFTHWHNTASDAGAAALTGSGPSRAPYYIVELISDKAPCNPSAPTTASLNCKRFRITASSDSSDGRARVVLQSIYATQ